MIKMQNEGSTILGKTTGRRMREIRKNKDISIVELAKTIGVSKSLISQVERGEILPSLSTLEKVANALEIDITEFFKIEGPRCLSEGEIVVRKNNRKVITIPNSSMVYYLLTPNLHQNLEFLIIEIPPHGEKQNEIETFKHDGEEYFLVLEGELQLDIGTESYSLEQGDSGCFDSSHGHIWRNVKDQKGVFLIAATAALVAQKRL